MEKNYLNKEYPETIQDGETRQKCKGEPEVYSRVVGFYRPTKLWNHGKKEEFKNRVTFKVSNESKNIKPEQKEA